MIALMIGGPQDGQVIETDNVSRLEGREPPKPGLDLDTDVLCGKPVYYDRTEVEILSVKVPVFIQRDWPAERVEATLAAHLLSDLAHRLAEQT